MQRLLLAVSAAILVSALAACSGNSAPPVTTTGTGLDGQLVQGTGTKVTTALGDGLGGIQVQLISQASGQVVGATTTTADGRFSFRQLPNGQFLLKLRFNSSADLDGDGLLDLIESFIPVTLSADLIAQLTAALNFDDTDDDSKSDALKIDIRIRVGADGPEQHFIRTHRHRHGDTQVDDDGDGTVDDDFDDDDNDGLPDDSTGGQGSSAQWRGTISALSASSITVGGRTFAINDATTFRIRGNHDADAAEFAVGDTVKVKGLTNSDGTFTALEISLKHAQGNGGDDTDDNELELAGTIEALGAGTITVNGREFALTDITNFFNADKTEAELADFAVGDFVELKAVLISGTWTVLRLKADDDDGNDDHGSFDEIELHGTISALTATTVTLGGKTFTLDAGTEFRGGATGTAADFAVGASVELNVSFSGGKWIVNRISLDDAGDDNGGDDDDQGDDNGGDD